MEQLTDLLNRLMTSLDGLNEGVDSLQQAVGPLAASRTGCRADAGPASAGQGRYSGLRAKRSRTMNQAGLSCPS